MGKRKQYSFLEKKPSYRAKLAIRYGGVSSLVFILLIILSFLSSGTMPQFIGGFGFVGFLLSIIGFYIGIKDMYKSPAPNIYTTVGTLISGVIMMLWIGMYILGFLV